MALLLAEQHTPTFFPLLALLLEEEMVAPLSTYRIFVDILSEDLIQVVAETRTKVEDAVMSKLILQRGLEYLLPRR